MSKQEGNADWVARDEGRIPSKGAMAAERASAGLGATGHEDPAGEPSSLVLPKTRVQQERKTPGDGTP